MGRRTRRLRGRVARAVDVVMIVLGTILVLGLLVSVLTADSTTSRVVFGLVAALVGWATVSVAAGLRRRRRQGG